MEVLRRIVESEKRPPVAERLCVFLVERIPSALQTDFDFGVLSDVCTRNDKEIMFAGFRLDVHKDVDMAYSK